MKMLRTVIMNYEGQIKNELTEVIVQGFNENQKKAFKIILANVDFRDDTLNNKIAQELYNCNPSHSTYKSFKNSFRKDILKLVFLTDSKGSHIQKIAFELQEELVAINKLLYMGLRSSAKSQFNKTLNKALKYHQYEVARTILVTLVDHFGLYGSEKQQKEAIIRFEAVNIACNKQVKIRTMYGSLITCNNITVKMKKEYGSILKAIEIESEFDSHVFNCYSYFVKQMICRDEEYEPLCYEAINYFLNLHFYHSAYISIFRNRLLKCKISKGDFLNSKLVLIELMEDHRPFTYHWYLYALTYVRVLLYSGDTQEAYKWYQKVVDSRNYITLPKDHRNEWEVLGIYVYLMKDEINSISIRKVKYNLNYNKINRSQNNINFLIAELIYDIKSGKMDVDKKINHLQKLCDGDVRVAALCKSLKTGEKYSPKHKASFENEIVEHERLVSLI